MLLKWILPASVLYFFSLPCIAQQQHYTLKEDTNHVTRWNAFADNLLELHKKQLKRYNTRFESRLGDYGGGRQLKDFYKEYSYYDRKTGNMLSRIQWETAHPDNVHSIEVFVYDDNGTLIRDYHAAYLPRFRNAPIQTLINLHYYADELHAYRQFDASGNLIYEQCRGKLSGEELILSIEDYEIDGYRQSGDESLVDTYQRCFSAIPEDASSWIDPLVQVDDAISSMTGEISDKDLQQLIEQYNQAIWKTPEDAGLYLKRADLYFHLHDFQQAIIDYNRALALDPRQVKAHLGLGMAKGRMGKIEEAINDISVYLHKHPDDSYALTKRGVRYIWLGKLDKASQDLTKAISIDHSNSEAHDDLGVIYAQQKNYQKALEHFTLALQYDPSYQKAHHNTAMIYLLQEKPAPALTAIDRALAISPQSKNSLMLKGEILLALGKKEQAEKIFEHAEFLPDGNWSERSALKP